MKGEKIYYTERMKLAEILSTDVFMLSIVERLGIHLGFGEATVQDICQRYNLSTDLFLMICNLSVSNQYMPQLAVLRPSDAVNLLTYLRSSHHYYMERCFPRLHAHIHQMMEGCEAIDNKVINRFFDEYTVEVDKHFAYEDEVVFPYIDAFLEGRTLDSNFSIHQFEANHSDIDEKLNDLKQIIIKYLPERYDSTVRFDVLHDILLIERDLQQHTLMENKLLIPLVAQMEKHE